uniref:Uncharacterized protein n=1 Tax=Anguilla anguilla TaxID=7936 RepID=A0A0E9UQI4_ANGAN
MQHVATLNIQKLYISTVLIL